MASIVAEKKEQKRTSEPHILLRCLYAEAIPLQRNDIFKHYLENGIANYATVDRAITFLPNRFALTENLIRPAPRNAIQSAPIHRPVPTQLTQ